MGGAFWHVVPGPTTPGEAALPAHRATGGGLPFAEALARSGRYHPEVEGNLKVAQALDAIHAAADEGPA